MTLLYNSYTIRGVQTATECHQAQYHNILLTELGDCIAINNLTKNILTTIHIDELKINADFHSQFNYFLLHIPHKTDGLCTVNIASIQYLNGHLVSK